MDMSAFEASMENLRNSLEEYHKAVRRQKRRAAIRKSIVAGAAIGALMLIVDQNTK
jgi:hypothetical protein